MSVSFNINALVIWNRFYGIEKAVGNFVAKLMIDDTLVLAEYKRI